MALNIAQLAADRELTVARLEKLNRDGLLVFTDADSKGYTALLYSLIFENEDVARWLIDKMSTAQLKAPIPELGGFTYMHAAAYAGQTWAMKCMHEKHGISYLSTGELGISSIDYAIQEGHETTVKFLCQVAHSEINYTRTIKIAERHGTDTITQYLREKQTSVISTENGEDDITVLASLGELTTNMLDELFEEGKLNFDKLDQRGYTVLFIAIERQQREIINWLVAKMSPQQLSAPIPRKAGLRYVHVAALRCDINTLNLLGERGVNFDVKTDHGIGTAEWAIQGGSLDFFKRVLSELDTSKVDFIKLMFTATRYGREEIIRLLNDDYDVEFKCLDKNNNTLMHEAAQHGQNQVLALLLEKCNILCYRYNATGISPMHLAMYGGHQDTAKLLNRRNKGVSYKILGGRESESLLHFACWGGHLFIVKDLVQRKKLEPKNKTKQGFSVMHYAAMGGHWPLMKYLHDSYGISYTVKAKNGVTPMDALLNKGHARAADKLSQAIDDAKLSKKIVSLFKTAPDAKKMTPGKLVQTAAKTKRISTQEEVCYLMSKKDLNIRAVVRQVKHDAKGINKENQQDTDIAIVVGGAGSNSNYAGMRRRK